MRTLLRALFALRRRVLGAAPGPGKKPPAVPPRADLGPWLTELLTLLGERYQLGDEGPDGFQLLRRTGRARFNPQRVWLRPAQGVVLGDYEVRAHGPDAEAQARRELDARVAQPLAALGLRAVRDSVEDWGGTVLSRRYEGACADPQRAAAAVRFLCVESEQLLELAAE